MKRLITLAFVSAIAALAVSCQKESGITASITPVEDNLVYKTFSVSMPDNGMGSKTELSGTAISWKNGDEISIIEVTNKKNQKFTWNSSLNAFEGSVTEGETSFYALYPYHKIKTASLPDSIDQDGAMGNSQTAVLNGFDPDYAIMTATESDGVLNFRHGVAYLKLIIGADYISQVDITAGNKIYGRMTYTASTGAVSALNSGGTTVTLAPTSGTLVKGGTYYIPVMYNPSNDNIGDLTIKFTNNSGSYATKTTSYFKNKGKVQLTAGTIYNLGNPGISFTPELSASAVNISSSATGGSINGTITNPTEDGTLSAEVTTSTPAGWLTITSTSADGTAASASFSCTANETATPRTATVRLTYNSSITEDVTVTQNGVVPTLTMLKTSVSDITYAGGENLTITEAYELENCVDGDITVTKDGTIVTAASISGGTITYTIAANASSSRSGWVGLQLGEGEVQKVTINQLGVPTPHTYVLYRTGSTTNAQVCIGEDTCTYFSAISGGAANFTSGGITSPVSISFNPTTGAAEAYDYSYGFKFDSEGSFTFTTHASFTTTIDIYAAGKDSTEGNNTIKIDDTTLSFPNGTVTQRQFTLKKGTTYTVTRKNKELEVILVVVRES